MKKLKLLQLFILLPFVILTSCRKEFDDHYESEGNATIDKNIIQILREDPDFSLFIGMIDRLDLAATLGESAIYTCLAPVNKDVQSYLDEKGYADIKSIPLDELKKWVNYHFILGMYYKYDIDKKTRLNEPKNLSFFRSSIYKTRTDASNPGKYIQFYTSAFLDERAPDYKYLMNKEADGFTVNDVKISDRNDIDAANGVIQVLSGPLKILLRGDEAIAADTSLSIINNWLNRYISYSIKGPDANGKIDTTKIKSYSLIGANIANEELQYTFIAPTNKAIRNFFGKYMHNFYNEYDSIPASLVKPILQTLLTNGSWGMSDIVRGEPAFVNIAFGYPTVANQIEPNWEGGVPSSNLTIYKVKVMPTPPVLNSIEGGIYMNPDRYKEWGKMMPLGMNAGLTDPLQYNHPDRTLLVQKDEYWQKFVEDYTPTELDTLKWTLGAGVLNLKVTDGRFEHRYYPTSYGALLYEDGTFTDYTGKKVRLLSTKSTWDGRNGSIYEVDNFLTPLITTDSTKTLYKLRLENASDYSLFRAACDYTGMTAKLKAVGFFTFTIFAPTNQAFIDAGLGDLNIPIPELKALVERHIVQRKIYSDGAFSGIINNLLGEMLTIGGAWSNFSVTDASGQVVNVLPGQTDLQANNGVFHGISKLLKKR